MFSYTLTMLTPRSAQLTADLFRLYFPLSSQAANGRIEKAVLIASKIDWIRSDPDNPHRCYLVPSDRDPSRCYLVNPALKSCTCPDASAGNLCKHRLAVGFRLHALEWYQRLQEDHFRANTACKNLRLDLARQADLDPHHLFESTKARLAAAEATEQQLSALLEQFFIQPESEKGLQNVSKA